MKKVRIIFLFITTALLLPSSLGALDFGVLLEQNLTFYNNPDNSFSEYHAGIVPRVSHYFNDEAGLYLSGSFNFGYNRGFYFVPELLRTEFSFYSGPFGLKAGRFHYSDPLTVIADSLFDGIQVSYGTNAGRFSLGVWYTGLLYKKNARIIMTSDDWDNYDSPLDYKNFSDTYFAPNRAFASVEWEHLSLFNILQLKAAVIGQIDFSEGDKLHTQYFTFSVSAPFNNFLFSAGVSFEAMQYKSSSLSSQFAFLGELGIYWNLPTNFHSRLSITGHYASGVTNNDFGAFTPITTKYFGEILQAGIAGITFFDISYLMRINNSIGANISAAYFIRNDLFSFEHNLLSTNDKHLLGGEISAHFVWSPFSDLQINLGGGAFFPFLGNVWLDNEMWWRINISVILSLY